MFIGCPYTPVLREINQDSASADAAAHWASVVTNKVSTKLLIDIDEEHKLELEHYG
jgi:hypothetical protein